MEWYDHQVFSKRTVPYKEMTWGPPVFYLGHGQVLTRADQLNAKKKKNDPDGPDETKSESGDDKPRRKAKSRGRAKAKATPKQKAKARAKAKGKASPKRKSRASGKISRKETEEAADAGERDHNLKAAEKQKETASLARKLFHTDSEQENGEEEARELDPEVDELPPVLKKPASKRAPKTTSGTSQTNQKEEKTMTKAAAKRRPAAKKRPAKSTEEEEEQEAGAAEEDVEGNPKKKKTRRRVVAPQAENMESLRDDAMKGIIMQCIKEVKNMTYDDLKEHLEAKRKGMVTTYARPNVYWHSCRSACSMLLNRKKPFDAYGFAFKNGTWNSRMAAAFACSWLGATR